jgi:DNA-binding SARP family transcriptional activator
MRIVLRLFGTISVKFAHSPPLPVPKSCHQLLGFLILNRRRALPRSKIAGTIWENRDEQKSLRCLNTAIWRMREIEPLNSVTPQGHGGDLRLSLPKGSWLDVDAFERRIIKFSKLSRPQNAAAYEILKSAIRVYTGDAYPNIDAEWALVERERLRNLYLDALFLIACHALEVCDWATCIDFGSKLSREEPLREDVHRILMKAHFESGNRALAIRQFRICEGELSAELGIKPMQETRDLYTSLIAYADRKLPPTPEQRLEVHFSAVFERLVLLKGGLANQANDLDSIIKIAERGLERNVVQ